jgi:peptidyl-prolyl cis-trans isomerase D
MLDLLRKRGVANVVYGLVIVATVIVFVVQFGPAAGKKKASISQSCAATVKGWCIDPKDFIASYRLLIPRDEEGPRRAAQMGLRKIALDGLIERELLVSEAERLGLTVTKDELTDSIYNGFIHVSVPSDNTHLGNQLGLRDGRLPYISFHDPKTKQFDEKLYTRAVRNMMNRSPVEFREEQGRELLAAKMRDLVRAPVRVSEVEAIESYIGERSSATLEFITVSSAYAAKYGVTATDAEVQKWAEDKDNAKKVEDLVSARKGDSVPKPNHVRHILIKFDKAATTEAKSLALGKLSEAAARVKRGEAFADVAREVSQDPGSGMRGGDLGDDMKPMVTPFRKAAEALKPGEMTQAVETQFGYHLLTKDDPAKTAEVEAALKKDAARELYVKVKAIEVAKDIANKIQAALKETKGGEDAIKAGIDSLKKPAGTVTPLTVVSEDEEKPAATDAGAPAKDGGKSTTTTTAANAGGADAGAAPKKEVVTAKEITPDNDPDKPKVETSSSFNRGGDPLPSLSPEGGMKVLQFAFESKPGDLMAEPIRSDDAFVVVRLKEHKTATKEEFEKERETYMQTLLAAKQTDSLAIYVKRLRETAKAEIKIDQTYLADPNAKDGGAPGGDEEEE